MDGINIQLPWSAPASQMDYGSLSNYTNYGSGATTHLLSLDGCASDLKSVGISAAATNATHYSNNYGQFLASPNGASVSSAAWSYADANVHVLQNGDIFRKIEPGILYNSPVLIKEIITSYSCLIYVQMIQLFWKVGSAPTVEPSRRHCGVAMEITITYVMRVASTSALTEQTDHLFAPSNPRDPILPST